MHHAGQRPFVAHPIAMTMASHVSTNDLASFIWDIADLLRGRYRPSEYGKVILPFTVLRRLDCVLEPTKADVLKEFTARSAKGAENLDPFLTRKAKQSFYNTYAQSLPALLDDPTHVRQNLSAYVSSFSENTRDIFERFKFAAIVQELHGHDLLYKVVQKFAVVDLHPDVISNHDMGSVFENLIHRFSESANEAAGQFYTPRDVIRLMVDLLFAPDDDALTQPGIVRSFYDPTAGTGGILSEAEAHLFGLNEGAKLVVFGQELNPETYAICKADLLIKGQDVANIKRGNTLSEDGHKGATFDYMGANPPYGMKWEDAKEAVEKEHTKLGYAGRFGPGLPRINDGSLLFLLHMIAKMNPKGSRIGIVLNGSPLFTGGAGSGESEIRKYIFEHDLLETIVALPTDMFYNTPIATYIWILSNKKSQERRGLVQLIDASGMWQKMRKSLGSKRREMSPEQIIDVAKLYDAFEDVTRDGRPLCRILPNKAFGYQAITVERPLRDENGNVVVAIKGKTKGQPTPDAALRDTENVPLAEDVDEYVAREVAPHAPDAWVDHDKTKVGYEVPFNRLFYVFTPPRSLTEIDADLKTETDQILSMIAGLSQ